MRLFYQSLNGFRFPSPVFGPDDESGADAGDEGNEGGDEGNAGDQGAADSDAPKSRFADAGLGKFREASKEEGAEEDKEKPKDGDRPDWLNPKYKSVEDQAKAYNELYKLQRSKVDPDNVVPEKPDVAEYFGDKIELEGVDRLGLTMDDPGLKVAAQVFHEEGIGKATAMRIVQKMFKGMNEHAPAPIDPEQELKALGPNGQAAIDATVLWLEKLDREGKLSDEDASTAIDLMGTARGVRLLNKLRGMTGELPVPTGRHVPASNGMSPDEWHEAYRKAIADKDEKEQERLDKISAGVFGNGASSGSPIRGIPGR